MELFSICSCSVALYNFVSDSHSYSSFLQSSASNSKYTYVSVDTEFGQWRFHHPGQVALLDHIQLLPNVIIFRSTFPTIVQTRSSQKKKKRPKIENNFQLWFCFVLVVAAQCLFISHLGSMHWKIQMTFFVHFQQPSNNPGCFTKLRSWLIHDRSFLCYAHAIAATIAALFKLDVSLSSKS